MSRDRLHLVFAGGGTAGHLFPGLAVARRIVGQLPQARITFAGSGKPLERRHVAAAGFDYLPLRCRPSPRLRLHRLPIETFSFVAENLAGYLAARRFLRREHVGGVIGLGGYTSAAMARAAARNGVPLVLLEQNATAGRATRWLARWADLICLAMPQAESNLRCRCPALVTGNPIRAIPPRPRHTYDGLDRTRRRLLVLGGSSGAQTLNETVPPALARIRAELDGWQVVHQSGEFGFRPTCRLYRRLDLNVTVVPFIDDVPEVLAETDLAVSRAGGTTLSELAAAGVPAVLLPYPQAADDHQRRNADVPATAGGSVILDRRELPGPLENHLAAALSELLGDRQRRARMSAAVHRLARPHADHDVAELVLELVGHAGWAGNTARAA